MKTLQLGVVIGVVVILSGCRSVPQSGPDFSSEVNLNKANQSLADKDSLSRNLVTFAVEQTETLSQFYQALEKAGLLTELETSGMYTILAPSNQAIAALSNEVWQGYLQDPTELRRITSNHIILGRLLESDLRPLQSAQTLGETSLRFRTSSQELFVNDKARLVEADIEAENGVVHVIDTVLLP